MVGDPPGVISSIPGVSHAVSAEPTYFFSLDSKSCLRDAALHRLEVSAVAQEVKNNNPCFPETIASMEQGKKASYTE